MFSFLMSGTSSLRKRVTLELWEVLHTSLTVRMSGSLMNALIKASCEKRKTAAAKCEESLLKKSQIGRASCRERVSSPG